MASYPDFNTSRIMPSRPNSSVLSLMSTIFAMTAFILMWFGTVRCNFVKFTDTSGTSEPITREFGLWYYQYWSAVFSGGATYIVKTCHSYPGGTEIDASWKAARAFDVMALIFAIILLIVICIDACAQDPTKYSRSKWRSPLFLITGMCQGFTLLYLNSNACKNNYLVGENITDVQFQDTCSLASGAKCVISATVFWLAAALTSFQESKSVEEESREVQPVSLTEPLAP